MQKHFFPLFLIIILFSEILLPQKIYAQSPNDLLRIVQDFSRQIDEAEFKHDEILLDTLNSLLLSYLNNNLPQIPNSISTDYHPLSNRIHLSTSADKKLRVWSWRNGYNIEVEHPRHLYTALAEFLTSNKVRTQQLRLEDSDPDTRDRFTRGFCDSISVIPISTYNGQDTAYFLFFNTLNDKGLSNIDVQAYRIDKNEFETLDIFESIFKEDWHRDAIHISFDPKQTGQKPRFLMAPEKRLLIAPTIDSNGSISSISDRYTLDGDIFFKIGYTYKVEQGKTLSDIESVLEWSHNEIDRFVDSSQTATGDFEYRDSLTNVNEWLSDYLKATLPLIPESLTKGVSSPSNFIASYSDGRIDIFPMVTFASSSDQKMRIWTWNTYTGGSWICYENIVEFQTSDGIKVVDLERDLGWGPRERGDNSMYDTIYTVHTKNNKTFYIIRGVWQGDGRHSGSKLIAFEINKNELNTEPKIFPNTSEKNELTYEMSFGEEDCPPPNIKANKDATVLYIQHIGYNKKNRGILTSKWDVYKFNGEYFVFTGVSK